MIVLQSGLSEGAAVRERDKDCHLLSRLLRLCGMLGLGHGMTLLEVGRVKRGKRRKHQGVRLGKDFEEQDDSGQRGRDH